MAKSNIKIYIRDRMYEYLGPADWNSLTRSDYLLWCSLLGKMMPVDEALATAGYLFYKIPENVYQQLGAGEDLAIANKMRWLMDNKLTNNVIGKFRIGWRVFYGPANRLANLTIAEYRRTELLYQLYLKTGNRDYLLALAATLFRDRGDNASNDVRSMLTESSVSRRASLFKWALHPTILQGVKLFYEGCRSDIINRFPVVFPKPDPVLPDAPVVKVEPPVWDLEEIILAYAGGKLGNFEETANTNIYVFFKHLQQKIEEFNRNK